jgi:hypothetical protein
MEISLKEFLAQSTWFPQSTSRQSFSLTPTGQFVILPQNNARKTPPLWIMDYEHNKVRYNAELTMTDFIPIITGHYNSGAFNCVKQD